MCPGALPTVVCQPGSVLIVCPWLSSLAQTRGFSFWPTDLVTPYFISVLHTPYPGAARESGLLVPNTAPNTARPDQLLSPANLSIPSPRTLRDFPQASAQERIGFPEASVFVCVLLFSL